MRHPLVLTKDLLKRVTTVVTYCKDCGRRCEPFYVPDRIWNDVAPKRDHELCVRCFGRRARARDLYPEWRLAEEVT